MEQETQNNNSEDRTAHYGRAIAIVFVVVFIGFIAWYGLTGKLGDLGKITAVAPKGDQATNATTPAVPIVAPPTESFIITDMGSTGGSKKEAITGDAKILKAPINFKSFAYDAKLGKTISISGNCSDKYYTLLIFDSSVDYRKDPAAAQANRASQCPAGKLFTIEMNLKDINLQSGSYYLFIADQGSTGSWYNPR